MGEQITTPARIFITGATGFVGRYLVSCCHSRYPQALVFALRHRAMPSLLLREGEERIIPLLADMARADEVQNALQQAQPDLIFHLAAQSSVAASWTDPVHTLQVNAIGCLHLLEAAHQCCPTARILLVGSGEQYGAVQPADNPIGEDHVLKPGNPYAVSKATQDLYGYQYFAAYGLPILRVRAFNHFGPGQAEAFAIASFARQIALIEAGQAEPVVRVGNLEARRDFLPVEDVVNAYVAVAERGQPGEVYNVGSGQARSIRSLLDFLLSCAKLPIQICEDPAHLRPSDIPILEADISRIRSHTGWQPFSPLEAALRQTLAYWRDLVAGEVQGKTPLAPARVSPDTSLFSPVSRNSA